MDFRRLLGGRARTPEPRADLASFDRALDEQRGAYQRLLALAQGAVFLRVQREGELLERRATLARLHDAARQASRAGREDEARVYLRQKQVLEATVALEEAELATARADAHHAERALVELGARVDALARERRQAVAAQLAQRVDDAAEPALRPGTARALEGARERSTALRGHVDARRSLEPGEDPTIGWALRAL
jgi:phage shock protein A